jgi:hypothetical protein
MNTKIFKLTDIPQADIVLRGPVTYDPKDLFMTKTIDRYIIDYDVKLSNGIPKSAYTSTVSYNEST